jgi:aminoglycoside phosphotransferase (APT) family kinase protein
MTATVQQETDALIDALRVAFVDRSITSLSRRPYPYATSFALEELRVGFDDGGDETVILKDLSWARLLEDARRSKPAFLYDPRREVETHLRLLAPLGVGPRCYGAVVDSAVPRYWLLLERVQGVELWQVGEPEVWEGVAAWLASFHARASDRLGHVRKANPFLLDLNPDWFRSWCERARSALRDSDDARAPALRRALVHYGRVVDALALLPTTFVHGELYPSNVLVASDAETLRVCPVDWEMAATGPGLIDLAAMVGGWDPIARARFLSTYASALGDANAPTSTDLDRCRLHLALQWLGWSRTWQPPAEHAHDWIGEAVELAEGLGLS